MTGGVISVLMDSLLLGMIITLVIEGGTKVNAANPSAALNQEFSVLSTIQMAGVCLVIQDGLLVQEDAAFLIASQKVLKNISPHFCL